MAAKTVCGVACRGAVEVVGVARRSSGVGGCKARRLVSVACDAGARVSRELSSRMAPFTSPSSSFADALLATSSASLTPLRVPACFLPDVTLARGVSRHKGPESKASI